MRSRKADSKQRVNGNLALRFEGNGLTSYAGLEMVRRYLASVDPMRGFEVATTADRRGATRKRRSLYRFETIHTLRYVCLQRAGLLMRPDAYATLDVGGAPAVRERFERLDRRLEAA